MLADARSLLRPVYKLIASLSRSSAEMENQLLINSNLPPTDCNRRDINESTPFLISFGTERVLETR